MDEWINRAISRISYEIIERNKGVDNVALIGIRRGVPLADRLAKNKEIEGKDLLTGILILHFRDDPSLIAPQPIVIK